MLNRFAGGRGCHLRHPRLLSVSTAPETARPAAAVRSGSTIAVAIGVMNLATYAFTIVAARLLGPRDFGALTSVMNVLLVAGVISLALQATAARRIAHEPEDVEQVENTILLVGQRSALGLGLLFLLAAPLVNVALKLDSLGTAALLGVAIAPFTLMGAQAGVLQGERRWTPLALVYLAFGLPRLALGVALMWWRPDELVAFSAVAVSMFAPIVVGAIALRAPRAKPSRPKGDHTARALWWETVLNSQALLAFLILSNVDIVIARNTLGSHEAGLYAGGLIMSKAVLFLPQFVVVLAFPSMGSAGAGKRALYASLAVIAVTGAVVTAGVVVLSSLALTFVGGAEYDAIKDSLWLFAVLGTVLSMLQLLVYNVMAKQARSSVLYLWAGLITLIVVGLGSDSAHQLVVRVLTVDTALFVVLLAVSTYRMRRTAPARS
ncbi:MAG: polysaccharide biosynthesis protein [Marmoricola sp.]|nr:polysaccharide biosynthesis protein [Marmoricola sp.]